MKKIALLVLAFTLPLFADSFINIVIRDGKRSYSNGERGDTDLSGLGRHYAYFERNGVGYVIHDDATLDRLQEAIQPQVELGEEQAKLGAEQAKLGQKQAALGQQQAEIGAKQAAHWNDREYSRELQEKQRVLQLRQQELAEQQRPLAEQQRILGDRQREAGRKAKARIDAIFEESLRKGVAKRR